MTPARGSRRIAPEIIIPLIASALVNNKPKSVQGVPGLNPAFRVLVEELT
jgi:hypothetical protein